LNLREAPVYDCLIIAERSLSVELVPEFVEVAPVEFERPFSILLKCIRKRSVADRRLQGEYLLDALDVILLRLLFISRHAIIKYSTFPDRIS